MRANYIIKNSRINKGDILKIVSNYHFSNKIINYLSNMKYKSSTDIGVWKIKKLNK